LISSARVARSGTQASSSLAFTFVSSVVNLQ
jgi:hypothetical protein